MRVLSLFSGCGGLDLGFLSTGFECLLAVDSDDTALATHTKNLATRTLQADIGASGFRPGVEEVDVILAGPPCQGFSTLSGRDSSDPRNRLLAVPARLARELRPQFVIIENVAGAAAEHNMEYLVSARGTLIAAGYDVTELTLEMTNFGLPQRRRRIVLVGCRERRFTWDHSPVPWLPVGETTRGIDTCLNHTPTAPAPGSRAMQIAQRIGAGQKLCNVRTSPHAVRTWDVPEAFGQVTEDERAVLEALARARRRSRKRDFGDADPVSARTLGSVVGRPVSRHLARLLKKGYVRRVGGAWDITHTFNGKFRRPAADGIAPTVDTRFGDYHYVLHHSEHRAYSVREAARIQGFPDWFEFGGSLREQFRHVGNAVPPPAAQSLAAAVLRSANDTS